MTAKIGLGLVDLSVILGSVVAAVSNVIAADSSKQAILRLDV